MIPLQRLMASALSLCLTACATVPGAMTHNTQRIAANPPEFYSHATLNTPDAVAAAERERQGLLVTMDGLRREVDELRQLARMRSAPLPSATSMRPMVAGEAEPTLATSAPTPVTSPLASAATPPLTASDDHAPSAEDILILFQKAAPQPSAP